MAIVEQTQLEPWQGLKNPLTRVIVGTYSEALVGPEGRLLKDQYQTALAEAFPKMTEEQRAQASRFGIWSARNVVVEQLQTVDKLETAVMAEELADLAWGEETANHAAGLILDKLYGRERYQVQPLFQLLSQIAVERLAVLD